MDRVPCPRPCVGMGCSRHAHPKRSGCPRSGSMAPDKGEEKMSRAYRIRVSESLNRTLRAEDSVCSQLELLEVLPPEQMAALLREELKGRGFADKDGQLVRTDGDLT